MTEPTLAPPSIHERLTAMAAKHVRHPPMSGPLTRDDAPGLSARAITINQPEALVALDNDALADVVANALSVLGRSYAASYGSFLPDAMWWAGEDALGVWTLSAYHVTASTEGVH